MMKIINKNDPLFIDVYYQLKFAKAKDKHYKILSKMANDRCLITIYKSIFGTIWVILEDTDKDLPLYLMRK